MTKQQKTKLLKPISQWPKPVRMLKKTQGQKSRWTVPLNKILVRGFSGPRYKLLIKLFASRKFVSRVTSNFFDNFLEAFKQKQACSYALNGLKWICMIPWIQTLQCRAHPINKIIFFTSIISFLFIVVLSTQDGQMKVEHKRRKNINSF